ncbi:LysM peptidoglycan-binding domain-containing protein [Latilactobacillus sakei]|uniref:aggregation-promoting factor n=1 Tax=Latilactobacillus sakei TaxID=1599 RepID=UPI000FFBE32A|nr:LysM domain-containing protein [Latilactobacillus sakei]RXA79778.1 LysM peptidoglycan-binding domain-containing protein [Latilactobacillus sakei]UNC20470.1 LysM peptidoglycan-binding domain-containing protein [Latilactobacillus sakei]UNC20476.1 LysM peptidoglycan-binding domain-containing protein [Latilactobacillus sakei]UNC22365.1 LysM peptidoglycan-binding domain-containing protein [Latilactobacillus sakei]UNC22371.1 LysM peptidoglycan-binding domain-containing protein [Latilactobacillus 
MKSLKTLLFSATLSTAATAGLLFASNGHADAATNYTVVSGDTLSSISQKFAGNSSLIEKIANANKIANKNLIYVGETLTIDEETQTVTVAPATTPVATQQTTQAPVATQQPVQKAATQTQPVQQPVQTTPVVKQQQTTTTTTTTNTTTSTTNSAKEWIANKESGGSYTASNGQFVGRYQLSSSYLNGDYSASNQERVADQYVTSRYGSWEGAKSFWMANGWY